MHSALFDIDDAIEQLARHELRLQRAYNAAEHVGNDILKIEAIQQISIIRKTILLLKRIRNLIDNGLIGLAESEACEAARQVYSMAMSVREQSHPFISRPMIRILMNVYGLLSGLCADK